MEHQSLGPELRKLVAETVSNRKALVDSWIEACKIPDKTTRVIEACKTRIEFQVGFFKNDAAAGVKKHKLIITELKMLTFGFQIIEERYANGYRLLEIDSFLKRLLEDVSLAIQVWFGFTRVSIKWERNETLLKITF